MIELLIKVHAWLKQATPAERSTFMDNLTQSYCRACGTAQDSTPSGICQCENDE